MLITLTVINIYRQWKNKQIYCFQKFVFDYDFVSVLYLFMSAHSLVPVILFLIEQVSQLWET